MYRGNWRRGSSLRCGSWPLGTGRPRGCPSTLGTSPITALWTQPPGPISWRPPSTRAPLVQVRLDGRLVGSPVFSPYTVELGSLEGAHKLDVTAFGSRINAFGALHSCRTPSPGAGRTPGAQRGPPSAMSTSSPPAVCSSPPSCSAWRAELLPGPQDEQAAGGLRRLACFCSFHRRSWSRLALGHCPNRRLYWREKLDRSEKPAKEAASVTA